ncbi:MAG: alpha-amylase family glycosyl hydrolase [Opitutaceae bacterium]
MSLLSHLTRFHQLSLLLLLLVAGKLCNGEAMLQYFNTDWAEITRKMPELAEAGYSSLWLPPPTKGSGGLSVGYDLWDPFDLGSVDQRNTVRTRYGTEAELLELVKTSHRFGIRVYFDNIMNHRAFDVPGYNENTDIYIYPGMVPEDFHLRVTEDGFYRKWDNTRDWNSAWQVQNLGLADLIDIAHETPNTNFGPNEGDDHPKYSFVRHPNNPEYYCYDSSGTYVGFGNVTQLDMDNNPSAFTEDVGAYLVRNVRWLMDRTKADGLRLDAVKHVPDYFFGQQSGVDKDTSDAGYLGGVQRQFNISRGFSDANHRDSVFETEVGRDDAMVFGEHLGSPPGYSGYWDAGMRLVDNELRSKLNGALGNPSDTLAGLDGSGGGGFSAALGVTHANSHDSDYSAMRQLQHAMYYTREGMGLVYTDGYYQAETLGESGGAFPRHANTAFLGQFADPRIPNLLKIHQDFARGFQQGLWGDADFLAYERRDNRNPDGSARIGSATDEVTMVVMLNDNSASGQARSFSSSFPASAYLYQYATGPDGANQTGFYKFGSELGSVIVPPGGYFVFGYRTPELSTLWPDSAVTLYQDSKEVRQITVTRQDGPDGDEAFNPYGFANRGYPAGETPEPYTYQMSVPVVTSNPLTIIARADGSAEKIWLKLDGGVDLNGGVPAGSGITDPALRDNPPAVRTDTWVGYEEPTFVDRQHPEKFAAVDTSRSQIGSPGAETYNKIIDDAFTIDDAPTGANDFGTNGGLIPSWIFHDPTGTVGGPGGTTGVGDTQYTEGASDITLWAKTNSVGAGFNMFVYYTADGSYPEGAGGIGRGTTQVAALGFQHNEGGDDWWGNATIAKPASGATFRYKIGVYKNGPTIQGSWWPGDAASVAHKKQMLSTFKVENWDPTAAQVHVHADYNSLTTGLAEGFHVIRAKAMLNRDPWAAASLYQTFTQTFYYDAETPQGEVAFPSSDGETVGGSSYEIVVRTDRTVEEVWFNIADSEAGNNDSATQQLNGNGDGFEPFTDANQNGVRDTGEDFIDLNGNGTYDATTTVAWAQATEVTANPAVTSSYQKEWRLRYNNIPASGSATITCRLIEASTSRDFGLDATTGHYTVLTRTVNTAGPLERINIAWPKSDGDRIDDNYTMKVYFSKALASGTTTPDLIDRFTFLANDVSQDRSGFTVDYGDFGAANAYHELSIPLPNLYNDVDDYLHELKVEYRFPAPDNRVLTAVRLVTADPSTKPFVNITQPTELDSDGQQVEIILPDGPGPDTIVYTVRISTSASVTNLTLTGSPAITLLDETYTDANSNGTFDGEEPYVDDNPANGQYDVGETFTDVNGNTTWDANEQPSLIDSNGNGTWDGTVSSTVGKTTTWDFPWSITAAGNYLLTASTGGMDPVVSTRNARVVLRETVETDNDENNDDDDDGLIDIAETNTTDLPAGNSETWTNGDVHIYYASGRTLPNTPDSDGDGLPDGLEVGWRTATTPPTTLTTDTNGDGFPNFIGDLDPPLYAVVENSGSVPGVGSQSAGDDRTRQAAGSVTDPNKPDTDGDGLLDGIEDANRNGWTDGDGASLSTTAGIGDYTTERPNAGDWPDNTIDSFETWTETSPTKADSDEDGLTDGYGEDKNLNGSIDGDTNGNRIYDAGEAWTETDPLNTDTDGDGLPDGWEVQYGLDPLDNGTDDLSTATVDDGNPNNGATGDPDADTIDNATELAAGTNPTQITVIGSGGGEGTINIGTFTDWKHTDLLALDEYNEGGSQGADVYRTNGYDNSRDIVAFSFRDGGAVAAAGDGKVYFRIDFLDLIAYAEQGEIDAYIVIDTGNPSTGERALPDNVDIATDMKWEVVVAAYSSNSGSVSVDLNRAVANNTTTDIQNPYDAAFGVERRDGVAANGLNAVAWSSRYDAVEIAVQRQALEDAGWLGDPATLNFQVFTTRDSTESDGAGDISGRNDIRDTIGNDWLASDYWKDQDNIRLNGKLTEYYGRSSDNDRGKAAKVMFLAHGNQAMQPGNKIQSLVHDGSNGYLSLLQTHEDYNAPLSLHITATLASALQWAHNPSPGALNDGPTFNDRLTALIESGQLDLLGSTFSDHIPKYFSSDFNTSNVDLAEVFLDTIYGDGAPTVSRTVFWAPERVLDDETLSNISSLGFDYTFADQSRHFLKWFGRSSALGTDGFRINEVNGIKIFPIHDTTSAYLDDTQDEGSSQSVRELLSRRARSSTQDQVAVLWRDLGDFTNSDKATSYDANVRWLASRPWIRVVTASQIINGEIDYIGLDNGTYTTWGTINRGSGQNLVQSAKDWVDHATQENYDNWFFGSGNEEGLTNRSFGATTTFGQVGSGDGKHADTTWQAIAGLPTADGLSDLAVTTFHSAMFQTAFHNTDNNDLSKFSTGDYIYPDSQSAQTLADFARVAHAQTRFANIYARVDQWTAAPPATTVASKEDIDLDGTDEYLLYNAEAFAVFEAIGGRMTAGFSRNAQTGHVFQIMGTQPGFAGSDNEDEGTANALAGDVASFRTSGFKDWFAQGNGGDTSQYVNATYTVTASGSNGWTFTSSDGYVVKTITLPDSAPRLDAQYTLTGDVNKLYVRMGLSPDLKSLMLRGQADLSFSHDAGNRRIALSNAFAEPVTAAVEYTATASYNDAAFDDDPSNGADWTTVAMRNQAFTQQVEIENVTGQTTFGISLSMDTAATDNDNDDLPNWWEFDNSLDAYDGTGSNGNAGNDDGDAYTNFEEYVLGLDLTVAEFNGKPQGLVAPNGSGGFTVTFPVLAGRSYRIWYVDNLFGIWQTAGDSFSINEDEPAHVFTDDGTHTSPAPNTVDNRFYKIEITRP